MLCQFKLAFYRISNILIFRAAGARVGEFLQEGQSDEENTRARTGAVGCGWGSGWGLGGRAKGMAQLK